jgi:hypothetical protein
VDVLKKELKNNRELFAIVTISDPYHKQNTMRIWNLYYKIAKN